MSFSEIKKFDCGSKFHPSYPLQEKISVYKPLLSNVIREVDKKCIALGIKPIKLNIEIKSKERWYGNHQPEFVDDYAQILIDTVKDLAIERFNLKSFDRTILHSISIKAPKIRLSYLIEGNQLTASIIETLDFPIFAVCPYFKLLNKDLVKQYQAKGGKVIPWTINEKDDMLRLANWGVDGIITDYPDKWFEIIASL